LRPLALSLPTEEMDNAHQHDFEMVHERVARELGLDLPALDFRASESGPFAILIDEIPIEPRPGASPAEALEVALRVHASTLIGLEELQTLVDRWAASADAVRLLGGALDRLAAFTTLDRLVRRLAAERVPLGTWKLLVERLMSHGHLPFEALLGAARQPLVERWIARGERFELTRRGRLSPTLEGAFLEQAALGSGSIDASLLEAAKKELARHRQERVNLLVTSREIRSLVASIAAHVLPEAIVFASDEIDSEEDPR